MGVKLSCVAAQGSIDGKVDEIDHNSKLSISEIQELEGRDISVKMEGDLRSSISTQVDISSSAFTKSSEDIQNDLDCGNFKTEPGKVRSLVRKFETLKCGTLPKISTKKFAHKYRSSVDFKNDYIFSVEKNFSQLIDVVTKAIGDVNDKNVEDTLLNFKKDMLALLDTLK